MADDVNKNQLKVWKYLILKGPSIFLLKIFKKKKKKKKKKKVYLHIKKNFFFFDILIFFIIFL